VKLSKLHWLMCCVDCAADERVTVAKLQVGLLGSARTLQKQLDRIASRADTNSASGLHYILQGKTRATVLYRWLSAISPGVLLGVCLLQLMALE
jgi:hypothetical protein